MKKFITGFLPWIILVSMFLLLIPGINLRLSSEEKNENIIISFNYDGIKNKITNLEMQDFVAQMKNVGVNTVSVMEDDINAFVSRGEVTCIKYNVLCHKYDDESIEIAEMIKNAYPDIAYDNYIVLIDRDNIKERFNTQVPKRYTNRDYYKVGSYDDLDLYIFFDGRRDLWSFPIGYDEAKIAYLKNEGFDITLIHKLKDCEKTEYLDEIDSLVKKYNIKYMNLKENEGKEASGAGKINYEKMADIINNNNMTLVLTENVDQLSNQKFFGYQEVFDKVVKNGGEGRVLRSYETYDDSQADETNYKFRTEQFVNSTVDRNIRFITLTLIEPEDVVYSQCALNTVEAVKLYKEKIEKIGYTVNGEVGKTDYNSNIPFNHAVCSVIMIMFMLLSFEFITGKKNFSFTIFALILSVLAFFGTMIVMPDALLNLYPTAYSVLLPSFVCVLVLSFVKKTKDKLTAWPLAVAAVALAYSSMLIGVVAQGVMLSGIDYYINNIIFRGIKLSLILPTMFTAIVYYFMFLKEDKVSEDIKKALNANIKVYWVLLGLIIGGVGIYYIIRSGNVNTISSAEQKMRSTLTEIFYARPRTKEFLIGYPCLVLFAYYIKHCNVKFINWALAVGGSILITSISNSFCHVFTDFSVIVSRTLNGLFVGIIISIFVYIANAIMFKLIRRFNNKRQKAEMK